MKRPALFFDRDNTLIVNNGYLGDPNAVYLVRGAADAVARAREMGFVIVTFSNQSGVARGMFTEKTVEAINQRMDELLRRENAGAMIDRHEFCPFHPEATVEEYRRDSDLRKPEPGMIFRAAKALDLDLRASWVVGDAPRDIEAGKAAGCRAILVDDRTLPVSPSATEPSRMDPDETVQSITEAIDVIEAALGNIGEAPIAPKAVGANPSRKSVAPVRIPPAVLETAKEDAAPDATAAPVAELTSLNPGPAPLKRPVNNELLRLETLSQQILDQLKRQHDHPMDFSLGKMLAGVTQILAIAAAISWYFYKPPGQPNMPILAAMYLQTLTITLLVMGWNR